MKPSLGDKLAALAKLKISFEPVELSSQQEFLLLLVRNVGVKLIEGKDLGVALSEAASEQQSLVTYVKEMKQPVYSRERIGEVERRSWQFAQCLDSITPDETDSIAKRNSNEDLLSAPQAAKHLSISLSSLRRYEKDDETFPQKVTIGPRRIAYRLSDLNRWLDRR